MSQTSTSVLTVETPAEARAATGSETNATTRFPAADTVATARYAAPPAAATSATPTPRPASGTTPAVPAAAPPPRNLSDVVTRIARAAIALSEVAPELANLAHDMEQGAARQAAQAQAIAAASARMTADLSAAGQRLQGCSKDIGSLVGTIRRIADQTRLLSLNASIEAARAGAAGKTFAIIAGEVQALAEGTAKATRQVDGTVATITANVAMTVAAVGDGRGKPGETGPAAANGDARDLHGINEQVQAIADIAYEHSAGACQVTAASQRLRAWCDDLLVAVGCFRLDAHQRAQNAFTGLLAHAELRSLNRARQEECLRAALVQHPFFELLYITDLRGRQVVDNIAPPGFLAAYGTSGLGMDWSGRPWFQAASAAGTSGRLYLSDIYRSAATGNFCFTIAGALCNRDGAPAGVVGADVSFTQLL